MGKSKKLMKKISEKSLLILWVVFILAWDVGATYGVVSWNGKFLSGDLDYRDLGEGDLADNISVVGSAGGVESEVNSSVVLLEYIMNVPPSLPVLDLSDQSDNVIWSNETLDMVVLSPDHSSVNVHAVIFLTSYRLQDLLDYSLLEWRFSLDVDENISFEIINYEISDGAIDPFVGDTIYKSSGRNWSNKSVSLSPLDLLESKTTNYDGLIAFSFSRADTGDRLSDPFEAGEVIGFEFQVYDPDGSGYLNQILVWKIFAVISGFLNLYVALVCTGLHNPISMDGRLDIMVTKWKNRRMISYNKSGRGK